MTLATMSNMAPEQVGLTRLRYQYRWLSRCSRPMFNTLLVATILSLGTWALHSGITLQGSEYRGVAMSKGMENAETVIMTTDTRDLQVKMDPGEMLDSWTITTL